MSDSRTSVVPSLLLQDVGVATVRSLACSAVTRETMCSAGLPWAAAPGDLASDDRGSLVAWRTPSERLVFVRPKHRLAPLLERLSPAHGDDVVAVDLSEAFAILQLDQAWAPTALPMLADVAALPAPGRVSACRCADLPVILLRPDAARWWLVVERPLLPHVNRWLFFVAKTTS